MPDYLAATRDASANCVAHPRGRYLPRYHAAAYEQTDEQTDEYPLILTAACSGALLAEFTAVQPEQAYGPSRCRRAACARVFEDRPEETR